MYTSLGANLPPQSFREMVPRSAERTEQTLDWYEEHGQRGKSGSEGEDGQRANERQRQQREKAGYDKNKNKLEE